MVKSRVLFAAIFYSVVALAKVPAYSQGRLPIYRVLSESASVQRSYKFAAKIGIHTAVPLPTTGVLSFVDTSRYLALPPTSSTAAQFNAPASNTILAEFDKVVRADHGTEVNGTRLFGHDVLTVYTRGDHGTWISHTQPLDITVTYSFKSPNNYPLEGPGAEAEIALDGHGDVVQLHYDVENLVIDRYVPAICASDIRKRIARSLPPGWTTRLRLLYVAPSTQSSSVPLYVLPWYEYQMIRPGGRAADNTTGFTPAFEAPGPPLLVSLSAQSRGDEVTAKATASGGTPPYKFVWAGSNPVMVSKITDNGYGAQVSYKAIRKAPPPGVDQSGFVVNTNETIHVFVVDKIGTLNEVKGNVTTNPDLIYPRQTSQSSLVPTYGCLSPVEPGRPNGRIAWQYTMSTPYAGGGNEQFCWTGNNVWPGDYIEPEHVGTMEPRPWIWGDADTSNFGVNTANLVIDIGDGDNDWIRCSMPKPADCPNWVSRVESPRGQYYPVVLNIGTQNQTNYLVPFVPSWGPVGGNDRLLWLLLDDCYCLAKTDDSGAALPERWGRVFNGIHVLTGFTDGDNSDGPFESDVAANILGLHGRPETIVQSWFDAAAATQNGGTPAAMGPAYIPVGGSHFISDIGDYYLGKGTVGPTIVPSACPQGELGYWYITGPTPKPAVYY